MKKQQAQSDHFDVIVAGGGPAGLSFARLLAPSGLKIAVIEQQSESVLAAPPYDGREIALTHLSQKIMQDSGMWSLVADDVSLIRDAKVLNGASPYVLHFDHRQSGKDNLGFMLSNHLIRRAAYRTAVACANVTLLTEAEVVACGSDAQQAWVRLKTGRRLTAPLLIAADSRFSAVRRMMGIPAEMLDFGRSCIVCRMEHERPHDETAYECFFDARTLAVLPLTSHTSSVVITLDARAAPALLAQSPEAVAAEVSAQLGGRLGRMTLTSQLFAYPLVAVYAKRFYGPRFALLGDAAVGMHPVTAHGFNFGLRGGLSLAEAIMDAQRTGIDIGADTHLRRYHLSHRQATRPLYLGTNALVRLFTRNDPLARLTRRALLVLGNNLRPAKRLITNQLTEARRA